MVNSTIETNDPKTQNSSDIEAAAKVSALSGRAFQVLDNEQIPLRTGNIIHPDAKVITDQKSSISIRLTQGGGAVLGPNQLLALQNSSFKIAQNDIREAEEDANAIDFESLEKAIESGLDLNELLPAAAAGGNPGGGGGGSAGTPGVRFIFTAEQVLPTTGFETSSASQSLALQAQELNSSNQAPVAEDELFSAIEDTLLSGNLLNNDSDVNGDELSVVNFTIAGDPASYTAGVTAIIPGVGTFLLASNGDFEFTPASNYTGAVPIVGYTISDGTLTDTAQLVISGIQPVNDTPLAVDDTVTAPEDGSITIDVLNNDTDPDGDILTILNVGTPSNGTVTIDPQTGNPVYTPNPDYVGPDSFSYTITDPSGLQSTAIVRITVGPNQNDAPIAVDDVRSTAEDTSINIAVLGNDSDPDNDPLSVQSFTQAGNGQVTIDPVTGSLIYTPNPNYVGSDSFTYTIVDPSGATDTATVTINVGPNINDAPIAVNDSVTTPEDAAITIAVRTNDSDPDNDPLTVVNVTQGANGTVSIDPVTGNPTYTPNLNFVGNDSFTYTISDPSGATSTATVNIVVGTNINDAPIAVDDVNTVTEDGALAVTAVDGLLNNDSDPDAGDTFSITALNGSAANTGVAVAGSNGGIFVVNPDGSYTFDSNTEFENLAVGETTTTSINYTITDASGVTATASLTITVTGVNDAPVVDAVIVDQNDIDAAAGINLDVSGNFSDIDTDVLTFTASGLPDGLSISATGIITGTIDNSASQFGAAPNLGEHTVIITATDPSGANVTNTFTWQVTNPAPTAGDDSNTTTEDNAVSGSVIVNDNDPDGDVLTYTLVGAQGGASNGTVTININGSYTYTPNLDFNGTDTFTYQADDGEGGTVQANVVITVTPVNDAPVVDLAIVDQNNADATAGINLDISGNFSDIDVDVLTFTATGLPDGLSISTTGIITGTIDNSASQFGAAPNLGAHTVVITATDPSGLNVTNTFTWQVTNPAPTAGDDTNSTTEDNAVSGSVTANDNDPDGDVLSYTLVGVQGGASNGTVTLSATGGYTYTPNPDFHGTDTFTYQADDGEGGTAQASVVITVTPVNDAPVVDLAITDQADVDATSGINLDISGNFSDIDTDVLTFTAAGLPAGLSISNTGIITGTIDNSASQFGAAPNLGAHTVIITATDPSGANVTDTFTWQVTNPAPTAGDDANNTTEDNAVSGNVIANDNDPDSDVLTYTLVGVQGGASNGTVTISATGSYTYTPNPDFHGTDTFTYQADDGEGGTVQASVVITVTPINDAPVVDTAITDQNDADATAGISLDISGNFSDIDTDVLTFTATGLPVGLSISSTGVITGTIDNSASQFGAAPNLGAHTVVITATDPDGLNVTDTFTWQVTNPAPIAGDDANTTTEDNAVSGSVAANDSDPDGDILSYTLVGVQGGANNGTVTISGTGGYTYTPNPDFHGTDTFTYEADDGEGGTVQASVVITVTPVNDAPVVATAITNQADDDATGINLDISGNFSDIDTDVLTFTASGLPVGLSISSAGVITGTIDNSASQFGAAPNLGEHTVVITATDPDGLNVTNTFTWLVTNPTPTAGDDTNTTTEDNAVSGSVIANDNDPDGDVLTYTLVGAQGGAGNGTVTISSTGDYIYTPNPDFNGTDTFTYQADDGEGGTVQANVVITVAPINDAPVVDTAIGNQADDDAAGINLDISGNFSDIDTDVLTFTATGLPVGLSISNTGIITGTIDNSASQFGSAPNLGEHTVVITATDPDGLNVTNTFTWQVSNPAPTAGDDTNTTAEDSPVSGNVTGNDNDPDGDVLTYTLVGVQGGASNGTVTISATGDYTYTPNLNFNGTDTFTYQADDGEGGTVQASVVITVTQGNDAPVVDTEIVDQNDIDAAAGISLDVSGNFSDIDADVLTFTAAGLPAGLSISNTGIITGTIDNSASQFGAAPNLGAHTVIITATDPSGANVTDTFTWQVANPAPTAGDDANTTTEDNAVSGNVIANDNDPDGDVLTYTLVGVQGGASNGTVTISATGSYTYTPNPDFHGTDTFTYQADDGEGGTVQASVVITVTPINDAPVVDTAITDQNDADATAGISLDISGNFSDIDTDVLTFTAAGLPVGLSISSTGVITDTIDNSASQFGAAPNLGAHTVVITATDPDGLNVTDTFTWQVTNPAPIAGDDANTTTEDNAVSGSVTANDSDPDGDILSYTLVGVQGGANNGTVTISGTGGYTYTPNPDFHGTDTFTYQADDGEGGTIQASVVITVTPVNDAPVVATAIDNQADDDATGINLDISGNFSDIDTDVLTFTASGLPVGLSISSAGVITGTIDNSASQFGSAPTLGAHTVVITATDPDGLNVTDTFIWQVTNPTPTAGDDTNTTTEDNTASGSVIANDNDPDGDVLTYTLIGAQGGASNGTVTISSTGDYIYTPNPNFNGTDTFTYQADDGEGGTVQANVVITITPVNDAPVAVDDSHITGRDVPVTVDVITNDTDIDSASLVVSHINGTAVSEGDSVIIVGQGSVKLVSGQLVFTPAASFVGEVSFNYTVSDGALSDTADVVINVIGVDIKDDSSNDDALSSIDDLTQTIINGQIPAGGTISTLSVSSSGGGTINVPIASITINPDGSFSAIVDTTSLLDGQVTISLSASDTNSDSASTTDGIIKDTVTTVSIDPVAISSGNPTTITGLGEVGATIAISINGGVSSNVTVSANGTWTFTPGGILPASTTHIDVVATDIYGNTNTVARNIPLITIDDKNGIASGHITVDEAALATGSNPTLTTESAVGNFVITFHPDSLDKISVGGTDIIWPIMLSLSTGNPTTHLTFNTPLGRIILTNYDLLSGVIDYRYELLVNQNHGAGTEINDPIVIAIYDHNGDSRSDIINVTILDDVATPNNDNNATVEEGGNVVSDSSTGQSKLLLNDTQGADAARVYDIEYTNASGNSQTALVPNSSSVTVNTQFGTLQVFSDGAWTYTANVVDHLTDGLQESDNFSYRLIDGDGDISTSQAGKNITVTDTAPSFGNVITATVDEAGLSSGSTPTTVPTTASGSINLSTGADDFDNQFTAQTITDLGALNLQSDGVDLVYQLSANGHSITATANGVTVFTVTLSNPTAANAGYDFVLSKAIDHDASSTPIELKFGITVEDNDSDTDSTELTIIVNDDTQQTTFDFTLNEDSGSHTYNTNADASQSNTTITVNPSFGTATINADGKLVFTPNQHYSGSDTLTYVTQEPGGTSNTVVVNFTVTPVVDASIISRDTATSNSNEDNAVALGFGIPEIIDNIDQNGAANNEDNPERLGVIILKNIPAGTQILDGNNGNAVLFTTTQNDVKIVIVDDNGNIQPYMRSDLPLATTLVLTEDQFEQLLLLPPEHSGDNFSVDIKVRTWEVNDDGTPKTAFGAVATTVNKTFDIQAVTDPVDIKINGSDASHDVTIDEDSVFDLAAILSTNFQDLDGSENRSFVISNPAGNADIFVNGTLVAAGDSITIQAPGLSSNVSSLPNITIKGGNDFSGDINNIEIKLVSTDTDSDSSGSITQEFDSVTLNLFINPIAGDVKIDAISGVEDSPIAFLNSLVVTDSGSGNETITSIVIKALDSAWVLKDAAGNVVFTGDGTSDFTISAADVTSGVFQNYTLQAPAHSSADISLTLDVGSSDTNTVNGVVVTDNKVTPLNQNITVTPVAEEVGGDTDQNSTDDFTITAGHTYANLANEDNFFNLNSDGFALVNGWNNEDSDEAIFALISITIDNNSALANGSELRYTNASGQSVTVIYNGGNVEIPLASLASLEFKAPTDISGAVIIDIQGKTVDTDSDNSGLSDTNVSGNASLNFTVRPIADSTSLTIRPAQGFEDTPIALTIRPSSSDASETYNITISDIPAGAQIIYDGVAVTLLSGSATIVDFDSTKPLFFMPPPDSNADHVLTVEAFSVDTNGPISDTSPITTLPLTIIVKGVADAANVIVATPIVSEVTLDNNSGEVSLADIVTTALTTDIDGSEILSLKLTGLEAGITISGAVPLGGTGTGRSWAIDPNNLANVKIVLPENYSGTVSFSLSATTTDDDGATTTGLLIPATVEVTPSPEATINTELSLIEDSLSAFDFSILLQNDDNNETLTSVWISAADVAASQLQLFYGNGIGSVLADGQAGVVLDAGFFKLTGPALNNVFIKGADNFSGSQSLSILYEITDPSSDGTLPATTTQSAANYAIVITPITDAIETSASSIVLDDPSRASLSGNTITASANTKFTVNFVIEKLQDANANNNIDTDGSEALQRITIDNVPIGVTVENAVYIGNTDGNADTAQWIIETNQAFTTDTINQAIVFSLDGDATKLASLNQDITITAITIDAPSSAVTDSITITLTTDAAFDDTDALNNVPADVNQWEFTSTPPVVNEDTSVSLNSLIDATLGIDGSDFSITLTNLPPGTEVIGMILTSVDGVNVWTADGNGSDAQLQSLLNSIVITPPENFNSNTSNLIFNASFTSYAPGGARNDSTTLVDQPIKPVTDLATISIATTAGVEDGSTDFTVNIDNVADSDSANIVDGKLYLSVDTSNLTPVGDGTLSHNGTTLTLQTISGVTGVPDGQYYVIDNVNSPSDSLDLSYQAPSNSHGTVNLKAFVNSLQSNADNTLTSQSDVVEMTISAVNDGFNLTASNITGDEDSAIELQLGGTGLIDTDGSESVQAALLSGLPEGFIVMFGADAASAVIASNTGNNGNNNSWAIPAISNSLPAYIAIVPPAHWSGSLNNLQLGVLTQDEGLDPVISNANFTLTVTPVADGLTLAPATSFGNEGEIIQLQLNSTQLDLDGSETTTLTLNGLGEFAAFYSEGLILSPTYDAASDTYTIAGLSKDQLDDLGVIQSADHGGTIAVTAFTSDGSSTSATVSANVTVNITPVNGSSGNDNLLYDGNSVDAGGGSDTLSLRLGENIDFGSAANLSNFEVIDLMPQGQDHSLSSLSLQDVLDITDSNNILFIMGDSGDSVSFVNGVSDTWSSIAGSGPDAGYDIYTNSADASVIVKVETDIIDGIM